MKNKLMKIFNKESNLEKLIIALYFAVATVEVIIEFFSYKPLLFVFKPLIPAMLMVLYLNTSNRRNLIFFGIMLFSLITDVFFISNTESMLFLGLIAFFIHRLLIINFIAKAIKLKDYIPLLIAMIPFLFIFFYLLSISSEITTRAYYIVIIQNILISILAGIILSHYMMLYNKKDTWLFIFGLLSVTQYFIVFIEKYYLAGLSPTIFRPLAMILNTAVYYAFYKFVMAIERLNDN
jgi:hypothetical protein